MPASGMAKTIAEAVWGTRGCWDGANVWYSSPKDDVTLLDLTGKVRHTFGREQGLPPHDKDIRLYGLEPDKVLAYGQHGQEKGCWLALLSVQNQEPRVKLLHEARRRTSGLTMDKETTNDFNADIGTSFNPTWVTRLAEAKRELIWIGRSGFDPLVIDIQTGQVRVCHELGKDNPEGALLIQGPHVFRTHCSGVSHFALPKTGNTLTVVNEKFIAAGSPPAWYDQHPGLFEQGNWIVRPGLVWHRFDKSGNNIERLNSENLPANFWYKKYWQTGDGSIRTEEFLFTIE